MPALAKPATPFKRSRAIPAVALVAFVALAGSTAPSAAFVEPSPYAAFHHHDRHAPSGANVIGRGIGGLHHRLAADAAAEPVEEAMAACADRFRSYDPSTGTYLGYDGAEHPCP